MILRRIWTKVLRKRGHREDIYTTEVGAQQDFLWNALCPLFRVDDGHDSVRQHHVDFKPPPFAGLECVDGLHTF